MLSIFRTNRGFFDDFFEDFSLLKSNTKTDLMKTDITETNEAYILSVELPGYNKDDVRVSLENGYLHIEAQSSKENDLEDKDTKYIRKERYSGTVKRSYYVDNLSLDDIEGKFENGILHVTVPKKSTKEPEKRYLDLK